MHWACADQIEPVVRLMIQVERGDSQSPERADRSMAGKQSMRTRSTRVAERVSAASFEVDAVLMYTLADAVAAGQPGAGRERPPSVAAGDPWR